MKRLAYKLYIRWLALRWMLQVNLGDLVWYEGRKRSVVNGTSERWWTLGDPYEEYVPRECCRKVWSIANLLHSYRAGVRFYETSWLEIWVRNGIEPWVRALPIWPGKR